MRAPRIRIASLDAIAASQPVDRVAVRVTRFHGHDNPAEPSSPAPPGYMDRDTFRVNYGHIPHFPADNPPPMLSIDKLPHRLARAFARAFARRIIGTHFGRFIVIGYAARQNPNKEANWVCLCSCGAYEFRKAKSIRNPNNRHDMCVDCRVREGALHRHDRLEGLSG